MDNPAASEPAATANSGRDRKDSAEARKEKMAADREAAIARHAMRQRRR